MEIERDELMERKLIDALTRDYGEREGIHISELIFCVRKAWIRRKYNIKVPDEKVLQYARGRFLHRLFWVPGKEEVFKREGIFGTPDGYFEEDGGLVPLEMKTTVWNVKGIEDKEFWLDQLKSYCYLADSTTGYIGVFQIVGYGKDRSPKLYAWRVRFTKEELREHWVKLKARRDVLIEALESNTPPPKLYGGHEWECENCECREVCDAL